MSYLDLIQLHTFLEYNLCFAKKVVSEVLPVQLKDIKIIIYFIYRKSKGFIQGVFSIPTYQNFYKVTNGNQCIDKPRIRKQSTILTN